MKFNLNKGPYLRSKKSTPKIMLFLFISLVVVWISAIISHIMVYHPFYGLQAFLIGLSALLTTTAIDVIMALSKKLKGKEIVKFVLHNYSYITALIFALCLPVGTPIYVVVVGSIVGTLIAKYLFGGFGYNIFNPAAIARIFVGLSFPSKLTVPDLSLFDVEAGATVTSVSNWGITNLPGTYTFKSLMLGGYPSALGESFSLLLLIIGIVLIVVGVANFRLILPYLITVALTALTLGLSIGVQAPVFYMLKHLLTGGIIFGAVFMISDPVTAPKDPFGKILYAVLAGFLTMLIRVNSSYPEGVAFAIIILNILSPTIDLITSGVTNSRKALRYVALSLVLLFSIAINVVVATKITKIQDNTTALVISHKEVILNE